MTCSVLADLSRANDDTPSASCLLGGDNWQLCKAGSRTRAASDFSHRVRGKAWQWSCQSGGNRRRFLMSVYHFNIAVGGSLKGVRFVFSAGATWVLGLSTRLEEIFNRRTTRLNDEFGDEFMTMFSMILQACRAVINPDWLWGETLISGRVWLQNVVDSCSPCWKRPFFVADVER